MIALTWGDCVSKLTRAGKAVELQVLSEFIRRDEHTDFHFIAKDLDDKWYMYKKEPYWSAIEWLHNGLGGDFVRIRKQEHSPDVVSILDFLTLGAAASRTLIKIDDLVPSKTAEEENIRILELPFEDIKL